MLLSMNWIGDFVDLSGLDLKQLIHRFTLSTAEVEDVYEMGKDTHGVIVAEIASIENHPNSKKLHLLKINTGKGDLIDCVCGAPNVYVGMHVAFATCGGSVCGKAINQAVVGGYPSYGMCCSAAELGISADDSGLWDIKDDIPIGTDIKAVYPIDDIVFEVDNKSLTNRPDLWGHYGIAREFATLTGRPLKAPAYLDTSVYADLPAVDVKIEEPLLCYRYTGLKVDHITKHESPVAMQIRLFYCGSRAINLLADLTNYVMMELGQPMHAFDLRRVDAIEVKRFPAPFDFQTLDGVNRRMDENMLMICSHGAPVAIAGVMGGLASEIEDDTDSLLLESATFDGVSVRKTSAKLGLRTDACARYEKFLDPELAPLATMRFLALLTEIDPGVKVISAHTDVYPKHYETITLELERAFIDRYCGIAISDEEIIRTLTSLGFTVTPHGDAFSVVVPSWRATKDVTIKADLIEEITRIYGYDNFNIETSVSPLRPVRRGVANSDSDRIKDILVQSFALHEIHSYIWCDAAKYKEYGIEVPENVRVINAQTPDHAVLRRSLVPTMLFSLAENKGYADRYGVFEIGRAVEGKNPDGSCNERKKLAIALFDRLHEEENAYLTMRDAIVAIFRTVKHCTVEFEVNVTDGDAWKHPYNTAAIVVDGVKMGYIGVLHPSVKEKIDKKAAIAFAELDMDLFSALVPAPIAYVEPSKFPAIDIDLTFRAELQSVSFPEILKTVKEPGGDLLSAVSVADLYEGENGESITLRFTFCAKDRTLSKAELQPVTDKIIESLAPLNLTLKI